MDLVLCMTALHRAQLASVIDHPPPPTLASFDPRGADVEDPFGGSLGRYRAVARLLERMAAEWAERLLAPPSASLAEPPPASPLVPELPA
jgi:protein-tyrosine-phosphatase